MWRRELQVTLRAPIVYAIGGLFLAVQGIAFAGLVSALSDPRKPAPLGALLEGQLAGTLLTWVLQLVVITLLGMRTIADDKKSGGWELLLTAQVGEGAAVIGKWLAAATVYALLWVPTLAYLAIVAIFRVDEGGWDLASIATGYAGAIALGAALLAWAVAASAMTSTTLVAGAVAFALLIGIFLIGEIPTAFPDLGPRFLSALSLREQLTAFARGEVTLAGIVFVAGLAVTGLSLAFACACAGRRRRREVATRFGATAVFAVIAALSLALAVQHPLHWDASASRRNSLDPITTGILTSLPTPATITIVEPTLAGLAPIYAEVRRVADLMAQHGNLRVTSVDPASLPGGLEAAARIAGVAPTDLASNGGVVVEVGHDRAVVDRLQLVSIARDDAGTAAVETVAIERAITGALARLLSSSPVHVCITKGHQELPLEPADGDADWSLVRGRLESDGMTVDDDDLSEGISTSCQVLIVPGPTTPFTPDEALAVQSYLKAGGKLIVAAASRPITAAANGTTLAPTGLEGVLAGVGLGLPPAIAVDPSLTAREIPGALLIVDGYSSHPINEGFDNARPTLWFQPRPVIASKGATPLVSASEVSWGERDLVTAPPQKDADDLGGPIVLAALGTTNRVIAVGSAESFTTAVLRGSASAADLWLVNAIRFLAGTPAPRLAIPPRTGDQVRLVMTDGQRKTVVALSIAGIPLAWIVVGALVLVLRRRRGG